MSARGVEKISERTLLTTFIVLLGLAAGSYALSFVHLGPFAMGAALAISTLKAILVALIFMELLVEPFTNRVTLIVATFFIAILLGLMLADVHTRGAPPLLPTRVERSAP